MRNPKLISLLLVLMALMQTTNVLAADDNTASVYKYGYYTNFTDDRSVLPERMRSTASGDGSDEGYIRLNSQKNPLASSMTSFIGVNVSKKDTVPQLVNISKDTDGAARWIFTCTDKDAGKYIIKNMGTGQILQHHEERFAAKAPYISNIYDSCGFNGGRCIKYHVTDVSPLTRYKIKFTITTGMEMWSYDRAVTVYASKTKDGEYSSLVNFSMKGHETKTYEISDTAVLNNYSYYKIDMDCYGDDFTITPTVELTDTHYNADGTKQLQLTPGFRELDDPNYCPEHLPLIFNNDVSDGCDVKVNNYFSFAADTLQGEVKSISIRFNDENDTDVMSGFALYGSKDPEIYTSDHYYDGWTKIDIEGQDKAIPNNVTYTFNLPSGVCYPSYKLVVAPGASGDGQIHVTMLTMNVAAPDDRGKGTLTLSDTISDNCTFALKQGETFLGANPISSTRGEKSFYLTTENGDYDLYCTEDGTLGLKPSTDSAYSAYPLVIPEAYFMMNSKEYSEKSKYVSTMLEDRNTLVEKYLDEHNLAGDASKEKWAKNILFPYESATQSDLKHFNVDAIDSLYIIAQNYNKSLYYMADIQAELKKLKHFLPVAPKASNILGTYDQDERDEALFSLQEAWDSLKISNYYIIQTTRKNAYGLSCFGTEKLYLLRATDKSKDGTYYMNSVDKALTFTQKKQLRSLFRYGQDNDLQNLIEQNYLDVEDIELNSDAEEIHFSLAFDSYDDEVKASGSDVVIYSIDKTTGEPHNFLYLDGGEMKASDTYPFSYANWTTEEADQDFMKELVNTVMGDILDKAAVPGTLDPESSTYKWLKMRYNDLQDMTKITVDNVIEFSDACDYAINDEKSMIMPKKGFYRLQSCATSANDYLSAYVISLPMGEGQGEAKGLKLVSAADNADADSTLFFCDYKDTSETGLSTSASYLINYYNGLFCNGTTTAYVGQRRPWNFELGSTYGTIAASYGGLYYGVKDQHTETVKKIDDSSSWICTPVSEINVTMSANGVKPFSCAMPIVIPSGVKAVIVTEDADGQHLVEFKGDTLTSNTGCFLTGTADAKYTLKIAANEPSLSEADSTTISKSMLKPAAYTEMLSAIQSEYNLENEAIYMINTDTSTPTAFYTQKYTEDGAGRKLVHGFQTFLVKALNGISMKSKITFDDLADDDAAGISEVGNTDMTGRDGKYIKNGKLFILRNGKEYSVDGTLIK